MQVSVLKPQIFISSATKINFKLNQFLADNKENDSIQSSLFKTLPDKGLNCLTDAGIEYVICTSILSASL